MSFNNSVLVILFMDSTATVNPCGTISKKSILLFDWIKFFDCLVDEGSDEFEVEKEQFKT
jgi:hypothetical protein